MHVPQWCNFWVLIFAIQSIFLSACAMHFFSCYSISHSLLLSTVHSCPYFADCAHFDAFSKFAGSFGIISLQYHCYNENNRSVFQLFMSVSTEALQKPRWAYGVPTWHPRPVILQRSCLWLGCGVRAEKLSSAMARVSSSSTASSITLIIPV